jgi:hypothetical protein
MVMQEPIAVKVSFYFIILVGVLLIFTIIVAITVLQNGKSDSFTVGVDEIKYFAIDIAQSTFLSINIKETNTVGSLALYAAKVYNNYESISWLISRLIGTSS